MIFKTIHAGSWDNQAGWQTASLIEPVRGRFYKEAFLNKEASMFEELTKDLAPSKGKAYLHVISLGSMEKYGANSNGDAFNLRKRTFTLPFPKEGTDRVIQLGGGLEEYHDKTFKKDGGVYKNHKNGLKKGTPSGKIIEACINGPMQRGELLLEVDEDKWSKDLEKMASGGNIYVSMGSLVPFDVCSICGNKASSREEYCSHLIDHMGQMDKEGNAVFAVNDEPNFHDISGVLVPADRIACGLWAVRGGMQKAASGDIVIPRAPSIKLFGYKGEPADTFTKLAKLEKNIIMLAGGAGLSDGRPEDIPEDVISELSTHPLEDVLTSLRGNSCMLSPKSFFQLVLGPRFKEAIDDVDGVDGVLPKVYSNLEGDTPSDLREFLEDSSYEPSGNRPVRIEITVRRIVPMCSLEPSNVSVRAAEKSLCEDGGGEKGAEKGKSEKEASAGASLLAREYARYQLAFLGNIPKEAELAIVVAGNAASSLCR